MLNVSSCVLVVGLGCELKRLFTYSSCVQYQRVIKMHFCACDIFFCSAPGFGLCVVCGDLDKTGLGRI